MYKKLLNKLGFSITTIWSNNILLLPDKRKPNKFKNWKYRHKLIRKNKPKSK